MSELNNDKQYASFVNDGHRMDRHFVPGWSSIRAPGCWNLTQTERRYRGRYGRPMSRPVHGRQGGGGVPPGTAEELKGLEELME